MNILFLTPRFPYPPFKGDQVRAYHQLRLLAQRHHITLLTFDDAGGHAPGAEIIQSFCQRVITVPLRHISMIGWFLRGVVSGYPFQTALFQSRAMRNAVQSVLAQQKFDLVHVQLARMAPYFYDARLPRVIDLIDALSVNMHRRHQQERGPMWLATWLEWRNMQRYERLICQHYDHATIVSASDRAAIGDFDNLHVNANGVELDKFPFVAQHEREPNTLVFSGNMRYFPNVNGVAWFIQHVFPLIKQQNPAVRFYIVGTDPHPQIAHLAQNDPHIVVTGHVESVADYLGRASVAVMPMQAGSGMQFKVIEAMACGTPAVVTPFGIGGVDVIHDHHLLIAHTPSEFAAQVQRLLGDVALRTHLAAQGRQLVETHYTWERSVEALEALYARAANR